MFKEGISSIFAKKKTKSKEDEEEDSGVTAILDVFGNGQVGRVTSPKHGSLTDEDNFSPGYPVKTHSF